METINTRSKDIENKIGELITLIGDDITREGLIETPKRVRRSFDKLYGGYSQSGKDILSKSFTDATSSNLVILKDIEFYSTCEHHMLPFIGKVSIGYVPDKKVVGISKLARLVEVYSRRLQIQERLTSQILQDIVDYVEPLGCMVVIEAQHLCMTSRGVEKQQSKMITSEFFGIFDEHNLRSEFLGLIK